MATNPGITAHPLCWPLARPRTAAYKRRRSGFEVKSFAVARDELLKELGRLKAKGVVLSTNVELRQDGLPYAGRRQPDDVGVAVYFTLNGRALCFACDCWDRIEDNLRGITKTVEALRGIARWGSGDMLEAAFSGFAALPPSPNPPPAKRPWWEVFSVVRQAERHQVEAVYRQMALARHPDRGGTTEQMAEINTAYAEFKKERGL